jgi:hypothetical protein
LIVLGFVGACATMTADECRSKFERKGLVLKGMNSQPTTMNQWAKDSCICGEPERYRFAEPRSAPAARTAGCTKDTDCKGDRICRRGSCEDPTPTSTEPVAESAPAPRPAAASTPAPKPQAPAARPVPQRTDDER